MDLTCTNHGSVDTIRASGYSLGHHSTISANERDLENVTFTIRQPADGEELSAEHVESDADDYLSKFANIYAQVAEVVRNQAGSGPGEKFSCPQDSPGWSPDEEDCWIEIKE